MRESRINAAARPIAEGVEFILRAEGISAEDAAGKVLGGKVLLNAIAAAALEAADMADLGIEPFSIGLGP